MVTPGEVEDDIAHLRARPAERRARAVPFAGRWRAAPPEVSPLELSRAIVADDLLAEAVG